MKPNILWTAIPLAIGAIVGATVAFPGARTVSPLVVVGIVAVMTLLLKDA